MGGGDLRVVQGAYPMYAGRWHHVAAAMRPARGTSMDLYANGERVAT